MMFRRHEVREETHLRRDVMDGVMQASLLQVRLVLARRRLSNAIHPQLTCRGITARLTMQIYPDLPEVPIF